MGELVYEMVWDCRYCAAKRLLALTHRHCPSCGSRQDPNARYFPANHEKVAVQSHEFVGADVTCPYCDAQTSGLGRHCGQCGASLSQAISALPQTSLPSRERAYAAGARSEPPKQPWWKLALPTAALLTVVVTVLALVWKR